MFKGVCSVHTSTCKSLHATILTHAYLLCVAQHSFADDLGAVGGVNLPLTPGVCASSPQTFGTAFLLPFARSIKLPNSSKCVRVCVIER